MRMSPAASRWTALGVAGSCLDWDARPAIARVQVDKLDSCQFGALQVVKLSPSCVLLCVLLACLSVGCKSKFDLLSNHTSGGPK